MDNNIQNEPLVQNNSSVTDNDTALEKNKMSKKQIIGIVAMSIIAVGGVLFGIFGMTSQNEKIAELTVRAEDAEGKITELETNKITITDPESGTVEVVDSNANKNPIIESSGSDEYAIRYSIPTGIKNDSGLFEDIYFDVMDGKFSNCSVSNSRDGDCYVSGLPDNIYKMSTIYEGNGLGDEKIGFLTTDGTVWFAYIYSNPSEALSINRQMEVKKAKIDGYVKDIISINYHNKNSEVGGYASTLFVMSDNSLIKYDKSMFE